MFRPFRERMKTSVDSEHEQVPMVKEKRRRNLQRTISIYDNNNQTQKK